MPVTLVPFGLVTVEVSPLSILQITLVSTRVSTSVLVNELPFPLLHAILEFSLVNAVWGLQRSNPIIFTFFVERPLVVIGIMTFCILSPF